MDHEDNPSRMMAVVKTGPGIMNVMLNEVCVPKAEPGFARLRVLATGICGTDIHIARDEYRCEAPVVMGHEVLGIVDQVGRDRDAPLVGTRCVTETYYSTCEVCGWCRSGSRNLCPSRRSIGSFEDGGFARYVVVPVTNLHQVADEITNDEAVLAEPLACVAQSLLDPAIVCAGDRVLVTGPGTIGQLAAQVAAAMGGWVTIAGLPKDLARLEVAASLGVTTTTEAPAEDFFDVVIECSGSVTAATAALRAAKRGGRYVQIGIFGKDVLLPFDLILYKELVVTSGFASTPTSWKRAVDLMKRRLVVLAPLVTGKIPIEQWRAGFDGVAAGDGIKTVIIPA